MHLSGILFTPSSFTINKIINQDILKKFKENCCDSNCLMKENEKYCTTKCDLFSEHYKRFKNYF